MEAICAYLSFLVESSNDSQSQNIPSTAFLGLFSQHEYKRIKTSTSESFSSTSSQNKIPSDSFKSSKPAPNQIIPDILESFETKHIFSNLLALYNNVFNSKKPDIPEHDLRIDLIKKFNSELLRMNENSQILDSCILFLKNIYIDSIIRLFSLDFFSYSQNPNLPDSYSFFSDLIPLIRSYNSAIPLESKTVFEKYFVELRALFIFEKPRLWQLMTKFIIDIVTFTLNLHAIDRKLLEDLKVSSHTPDFFENLNLTKGTQFSQRRSKLKKEQNSTFSFSGVSSFKNTESQLNSDAQVCPDSNFSSSYDKNNGINQPLHSSSSNNRIYHRSEILLTQNGYRSISRHLWLQLLLLARKIQIFNKRSKVSSQSRQMVWKCCSSSTFKLFDMFVALGQFVNYPRVIPMFLFIEDITSNALLLENVTWPLEINYLVNLANSRKRKVARISFPPDSSWPMVSHVSRPHTERHIYDQVGYIWLRESLSDTELERGPSVEKYISELLFQRASIDDIYASIKNHRLLKKRSLQKMVNQSFLDPYKIIDAHRLSFSYLNSSIQSNDKAVNVRELELAEDSKLLLDALVSKIEFTLKYIQQNSDFSKSVDITDFNQEKPPIPKNLKFWEVLNEIADQLFFFVQAKAVSYSEIHNRLYGLVFKDSQTYSSIPSIKKDNALIWLLLQLFHVERVNIRYISKDFSKDENILSDFLDIYNEDQILSKDGFFLRDMALQSALSHQQQNIKDRSVLKYRHPKISLAMPFSQSFYSIQTEFANKCRQQFFENKFTMFENQTLSETIKTATISQARQYVVPNTIYGYLIPYIYEPVSLVKPELKFLKGGIVSYKELDYINVGSKHRLLQLIYKMMLAHEQGPVFQFEPAPPTNSINCVSPYVLDVVFKLLYSSPYTNELMIKEVLEKLRLCDKVMAMGNAHFSEPTLTWLYTIYQLLNCRLLRYLKYYAHAGHLVHHLRHSLVYSKYPMLYSTIECFALCLMRLQHDNDFLIALLNPEYDGIPITSQPQSIPVEDSNYSQLLTKPNTFWFDCTLLYRNATIAVSRILTIRGIGDIPQFNVTDCLDSLSERHSNWAAPTLQFMAPSVRDHFVWKKSRTSVMFTQEQILETLRDPLVSSLLNDQVEDPEQMKIGVKALIQRFTASHESQKLFFCVLWHLEYFRVLENRMMSTRLVSNVRRILLSFKMSLKSEQAAILVDYAVNSIKLGYFKKDGDSATQQLSDQENVLSKSKELVERFVWKYMFFKNEHLIYGLVRGEYDLRCDSIRMELIRYLFIQSPGFSERLEYWKELDFPGRYWVADDYFAKQQSYLQSYPEFFEYEAFLVLNNAEVDPPVSLSLPMYYENCMVRLVPVIEYTIERLIEAEQGELLIDLLNHLSFLFRLSQIPLSTLYNILCTYFGSPTLYSKKLLKSMVLSICDLSQQDFSDDLERFIKSPNTDNEDELDNSNLNFPHKTSEQFILDLFSKISRSLSHETNFFDYKPSLPEIHYREIPNPTLLALSECVVEALISWCISQEQIPHIKSPLADIDPESSFDGIKDDFCHLIDVWRGEVAKRAEKWTFSKIWLKLLFEMTLDFNAEHPKIKPSHGPRQRLTDLFYSTGIFACSIPTRLMSAPYIRFLADVVIFSKELKVNSKEHHKMHFSFLNFGHQMSFFKHAETSWFSSEATNSDSPIVSDIFENFVHNIRNGTQNLPNTYLTLIHSIMHYGCKANFHILAETIELLAKGNPYIIVNEFLSPGFLDYDNSLLNRDDSSQAMDLYSITTDVQLLYICSIISPILYRLQIYPDIFARIIKSVFFMFSKVSNLVMADLDGEWITDAIGITIDFLYFAKEKIFPKLAVWKELDELLPNFPIQLRKTLSGLVYD
ncbi:hypothetical protein BB560_000397 [Smittium megazygosporum]|uniref:Mediator of RNA polymerase II transcription subunit 23 n=1 Tax=Smittium megazygosporum TaxID=133381 RepID=A0A2T9ZKH1_9FUNG|nr:hypothetical protein BB560_000397 [Smittium megazygosporum]